jgi:hypothetical protein
MASTIKQSRSLIDPLTMIDQIRSLQSVKPFETFSLELSNGRVIQIHDPHKVSSAEGDHHGEYVVGVLHGYGSFEMLQGAQIVSVSVGVHPTIKAELEAVRESVRKRYGGEK